MKKKYRLLLISLIIAGILLRIRPNNEGASLPKIDDVKSLRLIKIANDRGFNKWMISDTDDIDKFLQILKNSNKTKKESV